MKALEKATRRSTHKRHQTGCVIVNKSGGVIATGCSHSSSFRLSELYSIHAEIHALARGRFNGFTKDDTAYICTMARKSGNIVYSRPCATCAVSLWTAGIEKVIFSSHSGSWETLTLDGFIHEMGLKKYPQRRKR